MTRIRWTNKDSDFPTSELNQELYKIAPRESSQERIDLIKMYRYEWEMKAVSCLLSNNLMHRHQGIQNHQESVSILLEN